MADGIGALGNIQAQMGGGQNSAVTRIIMHYFQNRGISPQQGMAAVQKELAQGLKLIPHRQSVMGLQMISQDTAKVHFFTIGTESQFDADVKFFASELQNAGINTLYDSEQDPMTARALEAVGYTISKSDNPQFKIKATI
jgi:hypothetical protein